jgi:uncharacterized protein (TIGR03435 family)
MRIVVPLVLTMVLLRAQAPAAGKVEFEVASIKPSPSNDLPFNSIFPLGPGNAYVPNGGHFSAANYPIATYIAFAYEISGSQQESLMSQLPQWAAADHFDIQAQTDGNPAKDTKTQMRLMMRSLLADRCKLALHFETRQSPVFALMEVKPGKTGPLLQSHPNDQSCSAVPGAGSPSAGQFPPACGGLVQMRATAPGLVRFGARNVTMDFIASMLVSMGSLDRPLLDQTGLEGTFDFALEWAYQPKGGDLNTDLPGLGFVDAVREQLGLKLDSQKGTTEVLVVDHVERPSEN